MPYGSLQKFFIVNYKNVFFIPMRQDDPKDKPNSIVADFTQLYDSMITALENRQIEPVIIQPEKS